MTRLKGIIGLVIIGVATMVQASGPEKIKFPVKLQKADFLAGIWDVGPCYISGQPTKDALKKLSEEGIKTVICLRGTDEMNDRTVVTFDEDAYIKDLGMTYIHIPIGKPSEYSPEAIQKFSEALGKAGSRGKILVHCTVGLRASYVWASYLNRYQRVSLDEVIKVGEAMNMTPNRISMLLGAETTYSTAQIPKIAVAPDEPKKANGNKLVLTAPKTINAPDPDHFLNFVMWDMGDVLNSSQPTEKELRDLAAKGIKTVVNIRTEAEMEDVKKRLGFDEETLVKSLGMKYVTIPMQTNESFSPENLAKVADAFSNSAGKTLFHCFTATRTSTIWVAYLVKYYGVPMEEAVKHGEAMRFSNTLESFIGKKLIYKLKPLKTAGTCGAGK